ncbi:MAG TPA: M56 family metallopeptidase [Kofleriaceae bacterium]|nr:M56 family metallopeptidase [Kofleriaceae bacterium]
MLDWISTMAVCGTLLLIVAAVGAALLRHGSAAARHQVWALGVAAALLVPALASAVPSLPAPADAAVAAPARALQATVIVVTGQATPGEAAPSWPAWVALAWGAGALLVGLWFARAHVAAHRLARGAEPAGSGPWLAARAAAAAALDMPDDVTVARSGSIASPMTVGLLRPRVLLPLDAGDWSAARLRAVLLHELGHVRRRDTLVQLGAQLLCALHWWNPLAWLAASRLRVEREHACDDLVVSAGVQPSSYAADLLALARGTSLGAARAGAVPIAAGSPTEKRLRRILDPRTRRGLPGARFRLVARTGAIALTGAIACLAGTTSTRAAADARPFAAVAAPASGDAGRLYLGDASRVDQDESPVVVAPDRSEVVLVSDVLERRAGALERCYRHPALVGVITIHFTIDAFGTVLEHHVTEDTLHDDDTLSCLTDVVTSARYPVAGPMEVSIPFSFGAPLPDGC